jgi:hypothetical protein
MLGSVSAMFTQVFLVYAKAASFQIFSSLSFVCHSTIRYYIVTYMPVAKERLGKHIPEVTLSKIGHSLLGSGQINTHSRQHKTEFFYGVRAEEL